MTYFTSLFLDNEKDIIVNFYMDMDRMFYELKTPNHQSGNLIRNLSAVCDLSLEENEEGLLVAKGEVPCYIDADGREVYIFRLKDTKVANIYPDGRVEKKAAIPAIAKTLMSQTRDYRLGQEKTIFKTYIKKDLKFRGDLHTHMNGNLPPDIMIALGIYHQIRYPLYYVRKLELKLTPKQEEAVMSRREKVARQFVDSGLQGKYLDRRINDNTFINFADLIVNNLDNAEDNIVKIRGSLAVLKDGQAVFTNLEKVYLYRYVFAKGKESEEKIRLERIDSIPDEDVKAAVKQMLCDGENPYYRGNTIFQDKLLWIAREYAKNGIEYTEISDTTLVKKYESAEMLRQVHEVMPYIYQETGVMIRFLAAMRRIPLTIVKDAVTPSDYLAQNLDVLRATALDPYVAGCDFVGEEINDIITLKPMFKEIVKIAAKDPSFVIRIHAGENDSQKDNISHSILCVKDSLAPGQPMPHIRLGHGLYTYSLKSKKGKEVLKELQENNVVLEFQITSNVRLNNLNSLENHPLKEYLSKGIACVQGTDGAALYGSNSIDEQLSLEKMLELSEDDVRRMRETEKEIIEYSRNAYSKKKKDFEALAAGRSVEETLLSVMEEQAKIQGLVLHSARKMDANAELKEQIKELPWDRTPIILMGGSFNTEKRATKVTEEGIRQLESALEYLSPEEVFFVIGHKLSGYEKYLLEHNEKGFEVFSFVPAYISAAEKKKLLNAGVHIRVSIEGEGTGIYKSFNYEIFERRPSVVLAFDGNSAGANIIQEAKNGKGRAAILVWGRSRTLYEKAASLEGYVQFFDRDITLKERLDQIAAAGLK